MAFFGLIDDEQQQAVDPSLGILPPGSAPQQQGGILGMLRDPRVNAALTGASRGFANVAASGRPGAGLALSQGLAGAAEGATSWEEQQAKAAAERVNQMAQARSGVTDYRYQLELIAKRKMREEGMDEESAMIAAQQEMANRQYEQRGALADKANSNEIAREYLKNQLQKGLITYEMAQRLANEPDIAAAIETEKSKAAKGVEREQEAEGAVIAQEILGSIADDLALLPSPAMLAIEGAKAFVGLGKEEVQSALGRIATNNGLLIEYVKKLPGASTDREFPVFMASAGIAVDESKPPAQRIASARAAQKYFAGIEARQKARTQGGGSQPAAPAGGSGRGEVVYRRDPKTGKMVRSSQ